MSKFVINGEKKLSGRIEVKGAKNAALKIFPATLLFSESVKITNVPEIQDIGRCKELLQSLGAKVNEIGGGSWEVDCREIKGGELSPDLVNKFRASIMFAGPLLARHGEVKFPHPGGCVIGAGTRPIDFFLDGFKKMGAEVKEEDNFYHIRAKKLKGTIYFFPQISVTGTESLMMTAVLAEGKTILKNCALEPEITAIAEFLNSCGAKISGAGTSMIEIEGVDRLNGGEYRVIPDRIEAGTFAIMGVALNSGIEIVNCEPKHLEILWSLFDRIGANYELSDNSILIKPAKKLNSCDIKTHEYPGLATDLQSPYVVLMTQTNGMSLIHETIYDRRLLFTDMLAQMGANIIMCDPHRVVISGPTELHGRKLVSPDLRAGIAMVIAGMLATGTTEIDNIYQIERGYQDIHKRLQNLGADITKIED